MMKTLVEVKMKKLVPETELKRVQKFAVDLTLDPETAHHDLNLSGDRKQVNDTDVNRTQSFSSGRFYFEVQVKGKTEWDLGVTRELSKRKGPITLCPQKGYWTIWLRNRNEYEALDDPPVLLSLRSRPQKVGVFVDYEEGLVSFYDVEAAALIYSFTGCSFKKKLLPYFSPGLYNGGKNSAPLIISPVGVN
ncbi:E3 ubiquitin-protein ligase TRIM21-like [Pseudoliparis swirei]|uniref:E3 ubiquitin-protein ligase TRIM21-like n=1 Tax=Pseudoliparis swirei TaxID=2059687 RepID=UPI0024BE6928|nr:E3 ubiquitin-protein ligase TRIM21-like [Pseudoliparis swirei]